MEIVLNLSIIFLFFSVALNCWIYFVQFFSKERFGLEELTPEEIRILKKYKLYFKFRKGSQKYSYAITIAYIVGILLTVMAIDNNYYFIGGALALATTASFFNSQKISPASDIYRLSEFCNTNKLAGELIIIESICKKIDLKSQKR